MNALEKSGLFSLSPRFSDMFRTDFWNNNSNFPAVNIKENKDNFEIEVAAPGLKKEDFKITNSDGMITIRAEHEESKENKDHNYTRKEYNYNSFSRSFLLPENAKEDSIDAKYENGILKLFIAKSEEKQSAKKEIKVN